MYEYFFEFLIVYYVLSIYNDIENAARHMG